MHRQIVHFDGRENAVAVLTVEELHQTFKMAHEQVVLAAMNMRDTVPPHIIGTDIGPARPVMLWGLVYICLKTEDWKRACELSLEQFGDVVR